MNETTTKDGKWLAWHGIQPLPDDSDKWLTPALMYVFDQLLKIEEKRR